MLFLYWMTHLLCRCLSSRCICSFCFMCVLSADPCTHRLMMHAQLTSDVAVAHALFGKPQSNSFARLVGLPHGWLRGEVRPTRTAAKALTPRAIFPAFD